MFRLPLLLTSLVPRQALRIGLSLGLARSASATSSYEYKPSEYVTVLSGVSSDGQYAIAANGGGELGYDNFHIYLMDAASSRKIGPITEIKEILDTGAEPYPAEWSKDSRQATVSCHVDRRVFVEIRYRIQDRRAFRVFGPRKVQQDR